MNGRCIELRGSSQYEIAVNRGQYIDEQGRAEQLVCGKFISHSATQHFNQSGVYSQCYRDRVRAPQSRILGMASLALYKLNVVHTVHAADRIFYQLTRLVLPIGPSPALD